MMNLSCTKDVTAEPFSGDCLDTISYSNFIQPLMNTNCNTSGCHDASSAGGLEFLNYNDISTNANVILSAINHDGIFTNMPLGETKLADSLIQQFQCWIAQGKLEN